MIEAMPTLLKFVHKESNFSVVIDDDGKVAYAYLLDGDRISGDVWLYNCGAAPKMPEWLDPQKAPFANARRYVQSEPFEPVTDDSQIQVEWSQPAKAPLIARIFIREEYHAKLTEGSKPGWCRLAKKDGPLALVLSD